MDSCVKIVLRDMNLNVRIGLYESEMNRRQRICVNITLYLDKLTYLRDVDNDSIVDYAPLIAALRAWEEREHVQLVENYIYDALELCFSLPAVVACDVSVLKQDICPESDGVGLEVSVTRADYEASISREA